MDIIEAFNRTWGLRRRVAAALGITDSAVSQWRRVPAGRVLVVSSVTGWPREEIRPDIYPIVAAPPRHDRQRG